MRHTSSEQPDRADGVGWRPSPHDRSADHREGTALPRPARRRPSAPADLSQDLQSLGADGIAALLREVPCLAEAVVGQGPLAPSWPFGAPGRKPLDRDGLARLLASPPGTEFLVLSLDGSALALAQLAVWHGGTVTREQAQRESGGMSDTQLDAAAGQLRRRLLTDPVGGWVTLRPSAMAAVDLPGIPAAPALQYVNSDVLADKLRTIGQPAPSRKTERIDALVTALRDPATIERIVDDLPAAAARAFALLVRHGPMRVEDLGEPHWPPYGRTRRDDSAIGMLLDCSLIGVDTSEQLCMVWLDVLVGLRGGRLFGDAFPTVGPPPLTALSGAAPALPPVLEQLDAVLAHWRVQPADALTGGGLGVRPLRAAAKSLGLDAPVVGLLVALAVEIGLLGVVERGASGRGRNRRVARQWAPTGLVDAWAEQSPAWRWALLVDTWRRSAQLFELDGLPERYEPHRVVTDATAVAARSAWLLLLEGLPDGRGVAPDDVVRAAGARCPALLAAPGHLDALLAATRALGLVPPDGPVGLTAVGRAALRGPGAVEGLLPEPDDHVVVQADLTVIAPPDAAPDIIATLARWADLESSAGARVYRLGERRLATAMASGTDDDEILGWLKEHSRVGVPQNVEYLIRDVARRRGRLRAGAATTYLRSDDAAMLTHAVGVRAAKLRLLAPTVAVTPLSRAKLLAALSDAGVAAVAEDPDGTTVQPGAPQAERVGWHHSGAGLPAVQQVPGPAELAARLTADGREQTLATADGIDDPVERLKWRQWELDDAPDQQSHDDPEGRW